MAAFVEYTAPVWRNLNMRALKVDEAYLYLDSFHTRPTYLYTLSDECYKCPYSKLHVLEPTSNGRQMEAIKLNVARGLKFILMEYDAGIYAFDNETSICGNTERGIEFQEFGVYNFTLQADGQCVFVTDKNGVNIHLSILSVIVLVIAIAIVLKISYRVWRRYRYDEEATELATDTASSPSIPTSTSETAAAMLSKDRAEGRRMRSLDAFRGMAILLMIFVNSGGGAYYWLEHSPWNGLHVADVVFPSFLWIMGVCIPISIKSQLTRGVTKKRICVRVLWRSLKLFAIGLCLNTMNGPQLENLRIMGVLQRFGIAYLFCAVLHTIFSRTEESVMPQVAWKRAIYEIVILRGELIVMVGLIVLHLAVVFGLPVPGCPRGYLGPGGKHDYASHPDCIGGATGYIDFLILGNAHIYQHPTAKYIYDSKPFDPEGVFGCVLTIVQVLFGVVAGVIVLQNSQWRPRVRKWSVWSIVLSLISAILCLFSKESGLIPVNKNLWSLSFVALTSGLSFTLLTTIYLLIDVKKWWSGSPFVEAGKNAIILYVGHTIMHKMLPWHWRIGSMNTHFVLLLESTWNTLVWMGIALYLDYKQFYYSL